MIGDIVGGGFARVQTSSSTSGQPSSSSSSRSVSLAARGPFKISDNESPRPVDRVFATFNYFNNVGAGNFSSGL